MVTKQDQVVGGFAFYEYDAKVSADIYVRVVGWFGFKRISPCILFKAKSIKSFSLSLSLSLSLSIYIYIYHLVVQSAWISLTLCRHLSLSFIASGRSSGLHPYPHRAVICRFELVVLYSHIHIHNTYTTIDIIKHTENFNEQTNTLLYKDIPLTFYSRKGDVSCMWEVSWRRGQTATYWPQVLLTIPALLSHSGWAAQPWVTGGPSPLSGSGSQSAGILLQLELQLTQPSVAPG